jgi:microcystin-dependent protein
MATASTPNTFINGQNADANDVNANFSYIMNWLNTNVIQPDLANFSIFPTLPSSNPTNAYHAAHKNYVDLWLPAGSIMQYGGITAPSGWLLCDGTAYDGTNPVYSRLWGAIGTNFGGAGINAFQVPDLKGRVPIGLGAGAGLTNRSINGKGGAETHALTIAELASHNHSINHDHGAFISGVERQNHDHGYDVAAIGSNPIVNEADTSTAYAFTNTGGITSAQRQNHDHNIDVPNFVGTSGSTGSGTAHNNMQPFIVVNYLIRL